ncbi:MAG: hypothetical protein HDS62_02090 [Bacteroidales bacterium]|nr:hypothetical protein [Bacteroidales bacterium]
MQGNQGKKGNQVKIRPVIIGMKAGETKEFCITRLKSVRTQVSELSAIFNRKYKTHADREARLIYVTRIN